VPAPPEGTAFFTLSGAIIVFSTPGVLFFKEGTGT